MPIILLLLPGGPPCEELRSIQSKQAPSGAGVVCVVSLGRQKKYIGRAFVRKGRSERGVLLLPAACSLPVGPALACPAPAPVLLLTRCSARLFVHFGLAQRARLNETCKCWGRPLVQLARTHFDWQWHFASLRRALQTQAAESCTLQFCWGQAGVKRNSPPLSGQPMA